MNLCMWVGAFVVACGVIIAAHIAPGVGGLVVVVGMVYFGASIEKEDA